MSCCGPKSEPVPAKSSCCAPAPEAAPSMASSCCGPAPAESACSPAPSKSAPSSSCCGPSPAAEAPAPPATNGDAANGAVTHDDVSEYYGQRVKTQADLQTSACLLQDAGGAEERRLLGNVHEEILSKFYGCGSPIPPLLKGLTVLDLGCGTGRDVYLAAQLVGEGGTAIGVDMTDEQLEVARKHEEWHRAKFGFPSSNVSFRKGFIEDLAAAGLQDSSVDVVISNCVVNLAPDKAPVLGEIARVLTQGGELYFSDVFADRRIPQHLRSDKVLFGECLSGALYTEDFRRLMAQAGLPLWGVMSAREIDIENPEIRKQLGAIRFFEATVRAIKVPPAGSSADVDLDLPEDYGQVALYRGGIPQCPEEFPLDSLRVFPRGKAVPVDSATAAMLRASRFGKHFEVSEPAEHRGRFQAWPRLPACIAGESDFAKFCKTGPVKSCCG